MAKIIIRGEGNGAKRIASLYVYGPIDSMVFWGDEVSLKSIKDELLQLGGADAYDEVQVRINSPGGDVDEGIAIYNFLRSLGKPVTTIADGACHSIATVIFLAGSTRKIYNTTEPVIHMPWAMAVGNADQLQETADVLRMKEKLILDIYVDETGANRDELETLMADDKPMTAQKFKDLGFATEIIEPVKAFASIGISHKQNTDMKNKNKALSLFARAMKILNGEGAQIIDLDLTTKDGTKITVETDAQDPAVGDAVTVNGEPIADGSHLMSDDTTLVTAAGKIAEIKPAESTTAAAAPATPPVIPVVAPDAVALQAQIDAIKVQIAERDAQIAEFKAKNEALAAEAAATKTENEELTAQAAEFLKQAKKISSSFTPEQRKFITTTTENKNEASEKLDVSSRVELRVKKLAEEKAKAAAAK